MYARSSRGLTRRRAVVGVMTAIALTALLGMVALSLDLGSVVLGSQRAQYVADMAALAAALDQYDAEGGREGRLARYQDNCERLLAGLAELGLEPFLPRELQAPIIVTVRAPGHPNYAFQELYDRAKASGFILYPGKLTELETFRVGCIGAIGRAEIDAALAAIGQALRAMAIETTHA